MIKVSALAATLATCILSMSLINQVDADDEINIYSMGSTDGTCRKTGREKMVKYGMGGVSDGDLLWHNEMENGAWKNSNPNLDPIEDDGRRHLLSAKSGRSLLGTSYEDFDIEEVWDMELEPYCRKTGGCSADGKGESDTEWLNGRNTKRCANFKEYKNKAVGKQRFTDTEIRSFTSDCSASGVFLYIYDEYECDGFGEKLELDVTRFGKPCDSVSATFKNVFNEHGCNTPAAPKGGGTWAECKDRGCFKGPQDNDPLVFATSGGLTKDDIVAKQDFRTHADWMFQCFQRAGGKHDLLVMVVDEGTKVLENYKTKCTDSFLDRVPMLPPAKGGLFKLIPIYYMDPATHTMTDAQQAWVLNGLQKSYDRQVKGLTGKRLKLYIEVGAIQDGSIMPDQSTFAAAKATITAGTITAGKSRHLLAPAVQWRPTSTPPPVAGPTIWIRVYAEADTDQVPTDETLYKEIQTMIANLVDNILDEETQAETEMEGYCWIIGCTEDEYF